MNKNLFVACLFIFVMEAKADPYMQEMRETQKVPIAKTVKELGPQTVKKIFDEQISKNYILGSDGVPKEDLEWEINWRSQEWEPTTTAQRYREKSQNRHAEIADLRAQIDEKHEKIQRLSVRVSQHLGGTVYMVYDSDNIRYAADMGSDSITDDSVMLGTLVKTGEVFEYTTVTGAKSRIARAKFIPHKHPDSATKPDAKNEADAAVEFTWETFVELVRTGQHFHFLWPHNLTCRKCKGTGFYAGICPECKGNKTIERKVKCVLTVQ